MVVMLVILALGRSTPEDGKSKTSPGSQGDSDSKKGGQTLSSAMLLLPSDESMLGVMKIGHG